MTDQNDVPGNASVPPREPSGTPDWSSEQHPTPVEHTRPLPPYQPEPATATAPARRQGALTAGVLAGALLLGGAAGVGGAAWYDAWQGDDTASSSSQASSGNQVTATGDPGKVGSVEQVAARVLPSVVKINVTGRSGSGSGSGIVLSKDGQILTNNHVVSVAGKSGRITVNFNDGTSAKATIIGTDPVTDVAVIKAEGVKDLTPARIGKSDNLRVGASVVAVGAPFGLNATVTTGIVSALNRPVSVSAETPDPSEGDDSSPFQLPQQNQQQQQADPSTTYPAIQTDAAINPGNSGGPLVDMTGAVVGINSSIRTSSSGGLGSDSGGSIGLGFAIPIDEVLPIVNQILDKQDPTHARLGVTVSDVSGNGLTQGASIKAVEAGSAGSKAGLEKGDIVTKVNDQLIDGSESLVATIRGHRPGEKVDLTYVRDGRTRSTTATLGSDADAKNS